MDMADPDPDAVDTTEARIASQRVMLRELAELGMRLTRVLVDEVEAGVELEPAQRRIADPALMFSRLSRAIRMTLVLENRIGQDDGLGRGSEDSAGEARPEEPPVDPQAEAIARYHAALQAQAHRKQTVIVAVETLIDFDAPEGEADRMLENLADLLDPADDARFADAPLSQWIAAICRDLGLPPRWHWLEGCDWAAQEAVTWPDSPFAKLAAPSPPPERNPERWPGRLEGPDGPDSAEAREPPT